MLGHIARHPLGMLPNSAPVLRPLLLAAAFAFVAGSAWAEQRVALVIGNGAYESVPRLPNPPADAAAMGERLRRFGFQVTGGTNLSKEAMDRAIRAFGEQAGRADVAMVFYAGHGVQVAGRNYLVPVDAKPPTREADLRYDFVDVTAIMEELAGARKLRIVVLDACRDNPLASALSRSVGRSLGVTRGLAAPPEADNMLVAYATAADAVAEDGAGGNSPFTQALLAHIGDPGLDVRLMFGRVRDDVRRSTNNRQSPSVYASMGGESFAFNPGPADPGPVAAPAPRPDQDRMAALGAPPVAKAIPPPNDNVRFQRGPCGSVVDLSTQFEWFVGPDANITWAEAAAWVQHLRTCDGGWTMPQPSQLRTLFDGRSTAGVGYYTRGRRWPARMDPVFSGIGEGSWVWAAGNPGPQGAPAFNFNQGKSVSIESGKDFTVRVFAV